MAGRGPVHDCRREIADAAARIDLGLDVVVYDRAVAAALSMDHDLDLAAERTALENAAGLTVAISCPACTTTGSRRTVID